MTFDKSGLIIFCTVSPFTVFTLVYCTAVYNTHPNFGLHFGKKISSRKQRNWSCKTSMKKIHVVNKKIGSATYNSKVNKPMKSV